MRYFLLIISIILGGLIAYGTHIHRLYETRPVRVEALQNKEKEREIKKIEAYIRRYNGEATKYAKDIVEASNRFRIPSSWAVGIFLLESSMFRNCLEGYQGVNCAGFGVYGDTRTYFASNRETIFAVVKTLATSRTYTRHIGLVEKFCVYNKGSAIDCPYGHKMVAIINDYEN